MKKTLVAMAVLAASGATMAQVSLTGRVDLFLSNASTTTYVGAVGTELSQMGLTNGGLSGSRWALNGTEDLGGGLSAMFKLENRFSPDDATAASAGFAGDAYVAFAGGFGTVKLGRTYTAFDDARAVSNGSNVFDSSFTPSTFGKLGADYTGRGNNGIRYESPSFGGVSAAVSYSFGEDRALNKDASSITSLHLKYAGGPLTAALGYQDQATPVAGAATGNERFTQLSAAYDMGVASVSAGYEQRRGTLASGDDNGWNLGVNVPLGAAAVSVGYSTETTDVAGASAKATGLGLGATYSLSKRTTLYTGYSNYKTEAAGAETGKGSLFGLGVNHKF